MNIRTYDASSRVEEIELARGRFSSLPGRAEKIPVIVVENYPALGRLTALRFLEWVMKNPDGVIALPTGKSPEHFIRWVKHIIGNWLTWDVRDLLTSYDITAPAPPDMRGLSFVQIDEFYPIDSRQHNSFNHYVREFYIGGFGLDPGKALLIDTTSLGLSGGGPMNDLFPDGTVDLTLRTRHLHGDLEKRQKEVINRVDGFCMEYEAKIRDMGGIGFFLGGIGPDGHIAFNVRGSSFYSVTRLTQTNYETQAAAAADLGGMEIARNRLVITIGLGTIIHNPGVAAIIIAAGEAKAAVVSGAVEGEKGPQSPASVLQGMKHARFYLTRGAASALRERRFASFVAAGTVDDRTVDDVLIESSLARHAPLLSLGKGNAASDRWISLLLKKTGRGLGELAAGTRERMIGKIRAGLERMTDTVFLHTEPHHDDIMLAYLAHIYHLVRDPSNVHYFANLTSGFTAVTNQYMAERLKKLEIYAADPGLASKLKERYFDPASVTNRMADVYLYLDGVAAKNQEMRDRAEAYRLLRSLVEVYRTVDLSALSVRIGELQRYFLSTYPGAKDPGDVQTVKGTVREWEVELLWAYFGIESSSIRPLRLGFYTGDIFSPEPEVGRDAGPVYEYLRKIHPDVVTVAFDPEGNGPDTHYKALRAVAGALKLYREEAGGKDLRVWGYRNVWHRFRPAEANIFVPVSLNSLSLLHTAFMTCFGSQRAASFPNYEYDGPFSELAGRIQVEQYAAAKTCLGDDYFLKNEHPRLRAARGMIFLREMRLPEFFTKVRELREATEPVTDEDADDAG